VNTAVDSNILFDLLLPNPEFVATSGAALEAARQAGPLLICDVVVAEVRPFFADDATFQAFLGAADLQFSPVSLDVAIRAGRIWGERTARGSRSARAVADYLVAAHAQVQAGRLLTRDADFQSLGLDGLLVVVPGA